MILSICIPTYNPDESFYEKIKSILAINNNEFDIIISDNHSEEGISFFKELKDDRIKIYELDKNYGPVYNYVNVLDKADAKYALFITDKDKLNPDYLVETIEFLSKTDISGGYIFPDSQEKILKCEKYKEQKHCLRTFAYQIKHPTGYIYNTALMKKLNIKEKYSKVENVGFFPFEFIITDLAMNGNCALISCGLLETAKLSQGGGKRKSVSKTYSEKNDNLYFVPKSYVKLFGLFINHLNKLHIPRLTRYSIFKKLIKSLFFHQSFGYWNVITNNDLAAEHYSFKQKTADDNLIKETRDTLKEGILDYNLTFIEKIILRLYSKKYFNRAVKEIRKSNPLFKK